MRTHTETCEHALFVFDYLTGDMDRDAAFELAADDPRKALREFRAWLRSFLSPAQYRRTKTSVARFVEFDSSNVSHACAYYEIDVTAAQDVFDAIAEAC